MTFYRVYLMWVLVCLPACRCLCSKSELIDISPQGFSLGIGHTFKTFPTQSVLVCMELCISYPMCRSIDLNHENKVCRLQVKILCNGSRSPCSDLQHSSYGQGRLYKGKYPKDAYNILLPHLTSFESLKT